MLIAMGIFGLIGFFYANSQPRIYEARVNLQAGSPTIATDPNLQTEIARTLLPKLNNDLETDVGLLKSQRIFRDGLVSAATNLRSESLLNPQTFGELYSMYEVRVPDALNTYTPSQQRVVELRVRAFTPESAAEIANETGRAFDVYRKQQSKAALDEASRELRRQLQVAKAQSNKLDEQFKQINRKSATASAPAKAEAITSSLEQLKQQQTETRARLASSRAELGRLRSEIAGVPKQIDSGSTQVPDQDVDFLKARVSQDQAEYETLRTQFTDDSNFVIVAREKLLRTRKNLLAAEKSRRNVRASSSRQLNPQFNQLQSQISTTQALADGLVAAISEYDRAIAQKRAENVEAPNDQSLLRAVARDRDIADEKAKRLELSITNLEGGFASRGAPLINTADPSAIREPVAPEIRRWVILAVFAGALLGLAYSFSMESLRLPVHTSWQLAELTSLPVSAAVPAIPKPLARRHEGEIREGGFKPIESFRYMAFSLLARENKPKTIMFTGVGGDVGASAAAAEFAIAVARTGARTILLDCDLRNPQLSGLFGLSGRTGVSDILGATVLPGPSTDLLMATEHENLSVMPAGSSTEAGIADFQTTHLVALLEDLTSRADMVVIDCPAVDIYSDAARMAQYVDETCLVVSAKTTSYRSIPMAQEIMEKSGAKSMSIVLTNASSSDEPFGTRVSDSLVNA